jgi:transglutaminase-like putative cysteine protease
MGTDVNSVDSLSVDRLMPVLLGMLLVGLPLYAYLSWLVLWFMLVFSVWSVLIIRRIVKPPGALMRFVLAMLVVAVLLTSYGTVFGLIPGTSMAILLSYLKLFEIKSRRDIAVIIFLEFFLASSVFFHSQSVWIALYVFVLVIYLLSLLMMLADRIGSVDWRARLHYSTRMVLQSLPLMLILFLLFPRIPGPLWGLPKDALTSTIGISDEMSPGSINKLISSSRVAFRVRFEGSPPPKSDLYWRGLVLSIYDGKTWRRYDAPGYTTPELMAAPANDKEIVYRVTLEPHQRQWLFALEQLNSFDEDLTVSRELTVFSTDLVNNVLSYEMSASLHAVNTGLNSFERKKYLSLPADMNPETQAFAIKMQQQSHDDTEFMNKVLRYFSEQPFYYTLSPPLLNNNAMDDFLFNTRRGFCEHYSSAFVYMMRAAGLPARIVIGYQGGEMNPHDEYMIVRQSDAHAWTEVWVDNSHWRRVDPTAAVAPQRIERGIQNAGLESDLLPAMFQGEHDVVRRLRFAIDSFQHNWNQWVIGFDEHKQMELFRKFGVNNIKKSELALWLVAAMSVAGLLVAWWVIGDSRYKKRDRVRIHYDKFRNKIARAGIEVRPQDTPQELVDRIVQRVPGHADEAGVIIKLYQALVYGVSRNRETENTFINAVRQFRLT